MATQTFEELIAGANKIKDNELPESNTHNLVGNQLLQMTNKMQEENSNNGKKFSELEESTNTKFSELEEITNTKFSELEESTNTKFSELEKDIIYSFDAIKPQSLFVSGTKYSGTFPQNGCYDTDLTFQEFSWMKMSETIIANTSKNYYYLFADFQEIGDNAFYNLIIVDENDTPLYGYNIAGKRCVILPKNTRFKVVIPADSEILYIDCDVEQIEDAIANINQEIEDGKNIYILGDIYPKTYYEEGDGYMNSGTSLTFGSFGKHGIYSNIPENTQIAVSVKNSGGASYWYHLTDVNDNILESQRSAEKGQDFILSFGKYNQVTKLYISVQGVKTNVRYSTDKNIKHVISEHNDKINTLNSKFNVINPQSLFVSGTKYSGTFPQNGCYDTALTFREFSWMKMSETIIASTSKDYYYLFADFQKVSYNAFYNLIIVDENDTPLYGYNIAGKRCVILPKNTRFKVVIPADSEILYIDCDVEQIDDAITNINNVSIRVGEYSKTNYEEGDGYMNSGTSLTFGSFGKHGIYSNIPENTQLELDVENSAGGAYWYHLTDASDNILESYKSASTGENFTILFGKYNQVTKLYISVQGGSTKVYNLTTKKLHDAINDLKKEIDSYHINIFSTLNIGIDGDSTTAQGGYYGNGKNWAYFLNENLKFRKKVNMAQGNATVRDRTSGTSGTIYYPQWAPDVANDFISYFGLSDPNFAGDTGEKYERGTAEFDQATANNCLYSHIGYFIHLVNQGVVPKPDIFIFALAGINDLWTNDLQETQDRIGNIDDAINTNWEDLERNTILNTLVWGIQRIRKEYPNCDLFFKTPIQQTKDNHRYFYLLYNPLVELLKYMSVKIIDTYAELGAQSDFESYSNPENNHYTSDGTHPTLKGHEKDGNLVSNIMRIYYKLH